MWPLGVDRNVSSNPSIKLKRREIPGYKKEAENCENKDCEYSLFFFYIYQITTSCTLTGSLGIEDHARECAALSSSCIMQNVWNMQESLSEPPRRKKKALTMEDDDVQKRRPRFLSDGDISIGLVS